MPRDLYNEFEYDVALSFAKEDRWIAEKFAGILKARNIEVYSDALENAGSTHRDMVLHLAEIIRTKARYCVMFVTQHYPLETWTEAERTYVQEHALRDADEYFLPVRLDDYNVPGIPEPTGYWDLRQQPIENIANALEAKLTQTKGRSGPPAESHDLRSGNVASHQRKPDVGEEHEH